MSSASKQSASAHLSEAATGLVPSGRGRGAGICLKGLTLGAEHKPAAFHRKEGEKTENRMKMKVSSKFFCQTSECPETKAICGNGEWGRQEPSVLVGPVHLYKGTSDVKPTKKPVHPCPRDSAVWVLGGMTKGIRGPETPPVTP